MLKRIHPSPLWVVLGSHMAGNMSMCNGCSRVEPIGEVPAPEMCFTFELKVIVEVLFSSQTRDLACVCLGQGVRTVPCPHLPLEVL